MSAPLTQDSMSDQPKSALLATIDEAMRAIEYARPLAVLSDASILDLRAQVAASRLDTERLDAIERGDVDIERMGTTTVYHWVRPGSGSLDSVLASPQDRNALTLRQAIDKMRKAIDSARAPLRGKE